MFTSLTDFKEDWTRESNATRKFLSSLTDASLKQQVIEGHRTLGRMIWHIIQSIPEMSARTGLKVKGPAEKDPVPKKVADIQKAYDHVASSLLEQIMKTWTDKTLNITDDMYGSQWKRGMTLYILIKHEIHHRAQALVLARQAGIKVPGIYGPSKEEWKDYGAPPPEV